MIIKETLIINKFSSWNSRLVYLPNTNFDLISRQMQKRFWHTSKTKSIVRAQLFQLSNLFYNIKLFRESRKSLLVKNQYFLNQISKKSNLIIQLNSGIQFFLFIQAQIKFSWFFLDALNLIIQNILLRVLDITFESSNTKPKFGVYKYIKSLKFALQSSDFVIETSFFNFTYFTLENKLVELLKNYILVPEFIQLFIQLIKKHYKPTSLYYLVFFDNLIKVFFSQFDYYMQNKMKKEVKKKQILLITILSQKNSEFYKQLKSALSEKEKFKLTNRIQKLKREISTLFSQLNVKFPKISYIRYSHHMIIGLYGSVDQTKVIIKEIQNFFQQTLEPNIDLINFKVGKTDREIIKFFGFYIYQFRLKQSNQSKNFTIKDQRIIIRVKLDKKKILTRMKLNGFIISIAQAKYKPISCKKLIFLDDIRIMEYYHSFFQGIVRYFSKILTQFELKQLFYLLKISCAKTLGQKHRKSSRFILKNYGQTFKLLNHEANFKFISNGMQQKYQLILQLYHDIWKRNKEILTFCKVCDLLLTAKHDLQWTQLRCQIFLSLIITPPVYHILICKRCYLKYFRVFKN